ncbi:hypothetical protein C0995_012548 [Termitomyces sp. Mi166|nr:hypothetical protein C0995_012548 [Termitomyces sp. Mi166\
MFTLIAQLLLLFALGWALRRLLVKTDLDNIPGPEPESFLKDGRVTRVYGLFGVSRDRLSARSIAEIPESKHLHIYDPKALHHILVKVGQSDINIEDLEISIPQDQNVYEEPNSLLVYVIFNRTIISMNFLSRSNMLTMGRGLVSTIGASNIQLSYLVSSTGLGEEHKKQRKMLTPVFSTVHMRKMAPTFNNIAKKLETVIKSKLSHGVQEIDILHWMSRAALEMIGQSGLGYSFDSLEEGTMPHPFTQAAKAFAPAMMKMVIEREYLLPTLVKIGSPRFRRWVVDHFPYRNLHEIRDIVDTWDRTTIKIFEGKKQALEEGDEVLAKQIGQAKDLLSILMKANMEASEKDRFSFAFAATDTTSNALSRILHLLALHPEVQERLRAEVTEARKAHDGGDVPYDDLVLLPFMDAVCRETLRLARQDIVLPLSTPIKGVDGREMDSILVPKDTKVFVGILAANRDPLLWGSDSLEWKPGRWLAPLPDALHEAHMPGIYSHLCAFLMLLTFIGGGRACIGFKFSQLEMKVVLSTLISRFRFYPPEKEIVWRMTEITSPALKESLGIPQLPLKMELVD